MQPRLPHVRRSQACPFPGLLVWLCATVWSSAGSPLDILIAPKFSGQTLQGDSLRYQNAAGESFSFTRVSWLASGLALQRDDGSWLELTNQFAWFDLERQRTSWSVSDVPAGPYRSLRFDVGLGQTENHAIPSQFGAEHPLNPNLNRLHWNWQGGYVFMALEGRWRDASGRVDGWSFHFANDTNRTRITLPAALFLTNGTKMEVGLDLATLLNAPRALSFSKDGSSTHSREGDPIATALRANLPGAFSVDKVIASAASNTPKEGITRLYMPKRYTPHPFLMSAMFPIPDLPLDNPLMDERIDLGEKLFNERGLSKDGTVSCASCHDSKQALSDPRRYSIGVRGQVGTRNAMPLINLAWRTSFFWDGRAPSLRSQALMPIQDPTEMDETLEHVGKKLAAQSDYPPRFTAAFGSPEITGEKIGLAIESFLLTKTSYDSKFDRALKGAAELSVSEKRGFELFMTEYDPRREQYGADCFHCHGGPLFQSQAFANNGLDAGFSDIGRAKVTGKASDIGKFAIPSLRNVALTAPYMHDGRFKTLEEVIEHYSSGIKRSDTLDPNLAKHPDAGIGLSESDKRALVDFLRSLTDPRFQ